MINRDIVINAVLREKVIAIMRGVDSDISVRVAQALYDGGIRMVEVTFDQKNPSHFQDTADSIAAIAQKFDGQMLVGAGTVLTKEQVDLAAGAGALYIISPNTDEEVIRYTRELGLVSMPGALTPSEIMTAHNAGADFVKLFPIGDFGPAYVKAVRAPISHVKLLAVGGVKESNIEDFLKAGCVGAGIGGNLVNSKWIEAGEFDKITQAAKELVSSVQKM